MRHTIHRLLLTLAVLATPTVSTAQTAASPSDDAWRITIYPVLAWVASGIDIDVNLPPDGGDDGVIGEIVDSRFDGAYLGGMSVAKNPWRVDADVVWTAVGGDRPQLPRLRVDLDLVYFHVSGGRKIVKDLSATTATEIAHGRRRGESSGRRVR